MIPVTAVEVSENAKIGMVSATYVTQQTCDPSCVMRGNGCYAEHGNVRRITDRLNRAWVEGMDVAKMEADAIDNLSARFDLRLHVVGDCRTNDDARVIARAVDRYLLRSRMRDQIPRVRVWTYTHSWRVIDVDSWGSISVLASCESVEDVIHAKERGYATSIVVPEFASEKMHNHQGISVIPCPNQTAGLTCIDCRLCMDAEKLKERGRTIAFQPSGHGSNKLKSRLSLPTI